MTHTDNGNHMLVVATNVTESITDSVTLEVTTSISPRRGCQAWQLGPAAHLAAQHTVTPAQVHTHRRRPMH